MIDAYTPDNFDTSPGQRLPRLIVLNGPPGCGKSTLARRYVDDHPLALALDIDRVRDLLGAWRSDRHAAGLLARAIALAAARTHLAAGHDVVVPQLVARVAFLAELELVAVEAGAGYHEIVLLDSKENTLRRYAERGGDATSDEVAAMYDELVAVVATRPRASVVWTSDGLVEEAYRDVLGYIDNRV